MENMETLMGRVHQIIAFVDMPRRDPRNVEHWVRQRSGGFLDAPGPRDSDRWLRLSGQLESGALTASAIQ